VIDKKVMKILREKTGVTVQRIYQMIDDKKEAYQYSISKETAAYLVAADNGIDISKILKEDELVKVREVAKTPTVISRPKIKVPKGTSTQILVEIGKDIKVSDPLLPKKIVEDAKRMAEVYSVVYIFENSVRNLIARVLETAGTDWWQSKVGAQTKKKVKDRVDKEQRNRFHGKRGAHPIFYADIDDLSSIIAANWGDFEDIFPDQQWVSGKIAEIEMSRNVIAHNNPLEEHDIARLKVNFGDWIRQISQWTEKQLAENREEPEVSVAEADTQ
jgi:hypothetical protein